MSARLPRLVDAGLAAVVVGTGIAEVVVPFASRQGDGSAVVTIAATVLAGLALTQRRTHPLVACLAVLAVYPALALVTPLYILFFGQFLPMAIAIFSVARYGAGRMPFWGAAGGAAALLYVDLFVAELQSPGEIVFHWLVFAVVWGFGYGLRRWEQRALASTRRAIDAEVTAAEQALAAIVEERTRIARELHDIVAHAVTLMVVQAGAAEQVVDDDPDYVKRALATIRDHGTGALAEMRRVVAILREADAPGALSPQPGVDALPALVAEAGSSGLAATLAVSGDARRLPAGVDLAAYRIVQEALTNVRRHARASSVQVALRYGSDDLRIEVTDDGVGAVSQSGGHGLIGMRERAGLYGGRIETASADGAGFVVRVVLPAGH